MRACYPPLQRAWNSGPCDPEKKPACAGLPETFLLDGLDVLRLRALGALGDIEADLLVLLEGLEPAALDRREMCEQVLATAIGCNETETLRVVEPLNRTCSHVFLIPLKLT